MRVWSLASGSSLSSEPFLPLGCPLTSSAFVPFFDAIMFAEANGVRPAVAAYSVAIIQAGSFGGRMLGGPLADRFGVWPVFHASGIASVISIFAFWTGAPGPGPAIAGLVTFGAASGAWMVLVTASTAAISPVPEVGMRIGMLWSVGAIPNLVGPVICGVLIGADNGRFVYAGVFTGCTMLVGGLVIAAPSLWELVGGRKRANSQD